MEKPVSPSTQGTSVPTDQPDTVQDTVNDFSLDWGSYTRAGGRPNWKYGAVTVVDDGPNWPSARVSLAQAITIAKVVAEYERRKTAIANGRKTIYDVEKGSIRKVGEEPESTPLGKPPLGRIPLYITAAKNIAQVAEAIARRAIAGEVDLVMIEWCCELNTLAVDEWLRQLRRGAVKRPLTTDMEGLP